MATDEFSRKMDSLGAWRLGTIRLPSSPEAGLWLGDAVLCGCGFIYTCRTKVCPKCSMDSGVNLAKLLDKLAEPRR